MLKIAKNLALPLDFVTERIAFLARTGAGKSGGMRVLQEEMIAAGQFVVIIDPVKGDLWGIRAAGRKSGLPVLVMGGDHGDVPLEPTAGKFIAEFLVRERVSTVLDLSDFAKKQMVKFTTDFASTLYRRNRDVMHVFIDEADAVAGEKYFDPHCLEAIQMIQNKGRGRGFGATVATQRSAIVNKSVLFASGTLIVMQTTAPKDIAVAKEWLDVCGTPEVTKQIISELPKLSTREAFVYSPQLLGPDAHRIVFRSFDTFDSMRTPKPGEARQRPKSLAQIDLSAVERDMAATIEEAKQNDPAELKKEIAGLKRQLGSKAPVVDRAAIDREVERAVAKAAAERDRHWKGELAKLEKSRSGIARRLQSVGPLATKISELANLNGESTVQVAQPADIPVHKARPVLATGAAKTASREALTCAVVGELKLTKTQQRILDALAWYESLGNTAPTQTQVGAVARIDTTGGYFSNTVGPLSSAGLVERGGGVLRLTEAGRALAAPIESAGTLADHHETLKSRVRRMKSASNKTIEVLDAIIAAGGESLTNEEIGQAVGIDHTGGYYSNTIGPLGTAGLVTRRSGIVTPTDVLFPEGLY